MTSGEVYELLDGVGDACFATDSGGSIVYWGASAERCFGGTRKERTGKRCWEILGPSGNPGASVCGKRCELLQAATDLRPLPSRWVELRTRDATKWFSELTFGAAVQDRPNPLVVHLCQDVDRMKVLSDLAADCIKNVRRIMELSQPESQGATLTSREIEVLALCAKGHSSREIAKTLGIAVTTVRNHVQNILEKLECHTRVEAVLRAQDSGQL